MLLAFVIISLYMVKVDNFLLWKCLNETIFQDGGSIYTHSSKLFKIYAKKHILLLIKKSSNIYNLNLHPNVSLRSLGLRLWCAIICAFGTIDFSAAVGCCQQEFNRPAPSRLGSLAGSDPKPPQQCSVTVRPQRNAGSKPLLLIRNNRWC
jgi:hypothetical protein